MEYVTAAGVEVPALGFGTWPMTGETCREAVESALDLGYRHLDTAQMYDNHDAVGAAIANAGVDREAVFLTTKILRRNLAYDDLLETFAADLDDLGTDYVDLLLIHAPSRSVPIEESIRAMNRLQSEGRVDHIGVSNFSVDQLRTAIGASETPILTNQVEYHPYRDRSDLLPVCIEEDVILTAYTPFADGRVHDEAVLREIGDRYGKTPAQVTLRWLLQQTSVAAVPKARSRTHQRENLDVFDFRLTGAEMERVFDLGGGLVGRLRSVLGF
ncbi:aldehyde oxidoreductase [Halobacteriales archaeon QS_8_69_26]|nr:MAG: aldehyde oxidoreductase [Halobacteriales archaeon QS_8_69_26]